MVDKQKGSSVAFGALVTKKLKEHGIRQADLGRRIDKGRAYMSYLVHGKNPSTKGGKFTPSNEVVRSIAKELEIPFDEAFSTAGIEMLPGDLAYASEWASPPVVAKAQGHEGGVPTNGENIPAAKAADQDPMQAAANEKHPAKDKKKDGPKAKGKAKKKGKKRSTSFSDEHLFDIVYRASLEALRTGPSSDNVPPGGTRNVTIELPGGVRLVLSGLDESTSDKTIEGYKRVFLAAYRSVRG